MREVPAKPLPDTLKVCHAKLREHVRIIHSLRVTATVLEDRVVEHAAANGIMAAQLEEYIRVINRQRTTIEGQARIIGKAPVMMRQGLITKINA